MIERDFINQKTKEYYYFYSSQNQQVNESFKFNNAYINIYI